MNTTTKFNQGRVTRSGQQITVDNAVAHYTFGGASAFRNLVNLCFTSPLDEIRAEFERSAHTIEGTSAQPFLLAAAAVSEPVVGRKMRFLAAWFRSIAREREPTRAFPLRSPFENKLAQQRVTELSDLAFEAMHLHVKVPQDVVQVQDVYEERTCDEPYSGVSQPTSHRLALTTPRRGDIPVANNQDMRSHKPERPAVLYTNMREHLSNHARYRKALYRAREAERKVIPKAERMAQVRLGRTEKSERFDELTGMVPQVGINMIHGISPEVKQTLEGLTVKFQEALSGMTTNVDGTVDALRGTIDGFTSSVKATANGVSNLFDKALTKLVHLLWVVPLLGVCYYVSTKVESFMNPQVVLMISTILGILLPGGLWDQLKDYWPSFGKKDAFFDALEQFETQAGIFEPSNLGHVISIALGFLTVGKNDPIGLASGFVKSVGSYSRSVDSWSKLSSFILGLIEKFVNYVRNKAGADSIALFQTGVKAVDAWCTRVMEVINLSQTGGEVMTPDMVQHIICLRNEGTDLTNLYRTSKDVTQMLHKYLGLLDDLCRLCSSAMHAFKGGRPQPVVMGITGKPGVGKTYLCKMITNMVLGGVLPEKRREELDYEFDCEVFQKGSTEYWNGYAGQKAVIMDDWGQSVPVAGTDNDFIDLIRMANCWAYPLNFADLENKGKNFFRSDFILLTTNIVNLNNAQAVIVEPEAVTRRIDFGYNITVHPDFEKDGKIDLLKVKQYELEHDDFPFHAWILHKHKFAVGSKAVTDHTTSYHLKEVLDDIVSSIRRNKELHENNITMIKRVVKRNYVEPQAGIWERVCGYEAKQDTRFNQQVHLAMLRLKSYHAEFMVCIQRFKMWLTDLLANPIMGFLLSAAALTVIFLIGKQIFDTVVSWFCTDKKGKKEPAVKRALRKKENLDQGLVAQLLDNVREEDFEGAVEVNGQYEVRKQFSADVFRRAYERLTGSSVRQSNEPDRVSLPRRVVSDRRVIESDLDYQGDMYGSSIADVAAKNIYQFKLESSEGRQVFGQVLFVRDTCALMPLHFDKHLRNSIDEGYITATDKLVLTNASDPGMTLTFPPLDFLSFERSTLPQDDCQLVKFPCIRAHRDIGSFFIRESDLTSLSKVRVRLDTIEGDGKFVFRTRHMEATRKDMVEVSKNNDPYTLAKGYEYLGYTKYGDCGGIVNLEEAPHLQCRRIIGIHVAGSPSLGIGLCNIITTDKLERMFKELDVIEDLDYQSHTGFEIAEAPVKGSFQGLVKGYKPHSLNPMTSLVKTPMYGVAGPLNKVPAPMRPFIDKNGIRVVPMAKALEAYATPLMYYAQEDVDRAAHHAFSKFNSLSMGFDRQLFSFEEAVAGVPGTNINGIPRNTSPGFPYVLQGHTNKKAFFGKSEEYVFNTELATEVKMEVETVLNNAREGKRMTHVFVDFNKDELRSLEKAEAGKTRLISSAPLVYTIAFRMMFLAFTSAVQSTRIRNGAAIGINPYNEWNYLAQAMQSKGPHCVAGDFKGFDSSEQPQIHWAILDQINEWYNDGPENARIRRVLWTEVVHSRHYGGIHGKCDTVYQWNKSLPSGHPATSIINSFYNLTIFNMVWADLMGARMASSFWDYVYICTYGDDNILNIDPRVVDRFNQNTIEGAMLKRGMVYTTENKQEGTVATRPLSEIGFLKRSFRFEPLLGEFVGPQELDSILFISYWCKNKALLRDITMCNVEQTFLELSLHGDEKWNEWAPLFKTEYRRIMNENPKQLFTRKEYLKTVVTMDLPWL